MSACRSARVKIILFILTACAATLFATIQVLDVGSADTLRGTQKEFEAIIAAVIGGCLLTGGYGSAIGAAFGALIFGIVQMGIFYTGIDTDWFKVFLGAMVLIAVLFNNYHPPQGDRGEMSGDARASDRRARRRHQVFRLGDRAREHLASRCAPARCSACSATTAPASRR